MPEFVEWMMGLPPGWTDGPARTHRLRMLGNTVVPHQAALAMRALLGQAVRSGGRETGMPVTPAPPVPFLSPSKERESSDASLGCC